MCTVLLPPDVNPIAVNKYITSYINPKAIIYDVPTLQDRQTNTGP